MEQVLNQLLTHLERESIFLENYLDTLKKQAHLVAAVKIDELLQNVKTLNNMVKENEKLAAERMQLFSVLSENMAQPVEQVTISYIISTLDSPWREKLEKQKQKLLNVVSDIQRETETNAFVLNYAINFTHSLIQMQDKALKSDTVYSKNGKKNERIDQRKILNTQI